VAVVRILVDGYSLLHNWQELAAGKARHSHTAREELIHQLTRFYDAEGTPLTVVFDGAGRKAEVSTLPPNPDVEVIYTRGGQTADQLIERVATNMRGYGEVLVVTDDLAERDTVEASGALVSSCANFIQTMKAAISSMEKRIEHLNRGERNRFKKQ
jgi:predicted RNA-binding protein with PIN domain